MSVDCAIDTAAQMGNFSEQHISSILIKLQFLVRLTCMLKYSMSM